MKLFNKKEEKNKIGRPKLADTELKKKSIIMSVVSLLLVVILLSGGLVSFNIIPKFNKLKGTVNVNLCSEIPARYQPKSESNPEGTYDYGFTDPKFYSAVVSTYNSDTSYCSAITEDQLKSITKFSYGIFPSGITNVDGLEYLTNLTHLEITSSNISSINVSKNTALDTLILNNNNLSRIDVSANTSLTTLDLSNSDLINIDLSQNTALTSLNLSNNYLRSINVSKNTALEYLNLDQNQVGSIDLSQNTSLKSLSLEQVYLRSIDLSHNIALEYLNMPFNYLSNIDLSQNKLLTYLDLSRDKYLSNIDLSQNTALTTLNLFSNENLSSVDLSSNTALTTLNLSSNNLTSVDLSHNTTLTSLNLGYNYNLSSIDLSHNEALTSLNLYSNRKLSSIDLSKNTSLTSLYLYNNNLSSIDLSHNEALKELEVTNNNLSSIDLSHNTALTKLNLYNNNLTSIDLSHNAALTWLNLNNNKFGIEYSSIGNNITIEEPNVITAYPDDTKYSIEDASIATYNDGIIKKVAPGTTKLNIAYKVSNSVTFNVDHNINFINITSTYYTINEEKKIIDLNKDILSNVYTYKFSITPTSYRLNINDDKLEIKDSVGNIIGTYMFKNYRSYNLTSNYYTINEEEKTIDVNKDLSNNVYTYKFSITPTNYKLNINNNKLEIKDSNDNVIDTYKFINYSQYKLTSYYYTIDDSGKTIDAKGEILDKNKIYINSSNRYVLRVNEDKLEIIDEDKNVVDNYEIINARPKVEDAYLKAGFKDENLYAWVVAFFAGIEDDDFERVTMYKDYLLIDEEMQSIGGIGVVNQNITDTTGLEKLTNLSEIYLFNTNVPSINLSKYPELSTLIIRNGKLTSLDVSKNTNLQYIDVSYNNINNITGLDKLEGLGALFAYNNNLSDLDISNTTSLELLMVSDNPLANTLYMLKGKEIDYKKDFKLNEAYDIKYDVVDKSVVSYKDNKLKALKEGITNIYLSNENIYNYKPELWDKNMACSYLLDQKACEELENINEEEALLPYLINQEVKVYDITSKAYKIDKDKKIIDALNKDFDASKIDLTLNGLTGTLEDDKFIIKDKDVIVDTYTVTNIKKVIKEEVVSDSSNGTKVKPSDKVIEKIEERKEKAEENLEDIIIEGKNVPLSTLLLVKGKDRNIIVKSNGITITINGKDINKVTGNLDLNYEINILKESLIYEVVKDKVTSGIVLIFKSNGNLPGKVLVDVEVTDKIKKNIGTKDLYLYNYDLDKMMLIADKINLNNNKLSFYINKLGNYVLTNNEINKKNVDIDSSMYKENDKLSKSISNKKLIIPIVIFILLIILGVIGYLTYRKNKEK